MKDCIENQTDLIPPDYSEESLDVSQQVVSTVTTHARLNLRLLMRRRPISIEVVRVKSRQNMPPVRQQPKNLSLMKPKVKYQKTTARPWVHS